MWLSVVVALPLLPVIATLVFHYRERVGALCRSVFHRRKMNSFTQRSLEIRTHSFVLMNSTHGQPESVLQTFECYSQTQPTCSIGQEKGEFLDSAVSRAAPLLVLELGTHCGYSAIRMLRLLPVSGKLYTVEQDPGTADLGEEMILVAGFKHSQFRLLVSPSSTAIPQLQPQFGVQSLDLVFMDHDVSRYLPDLLALEEGRLLTKGCIIVVNNTHLPGAKEFLHYIHNSSHYSVCFQALGMQEIRYQSTNTTE
ncbi:transmembrane O-methyltransferase homolog [Polyodon spathula]|uniref:transmembrane O-methyltransferase homolog n=1 Tax=Polyodon spathula TaxID=7913 RepID=UPI001B7D9125|nr:transmembrane O-methyltransferase homolog [Polyodon spathula]